jgi:hypothetical protein
VLALYHLALFSEVPGRIIPRTSPKRRSPKLNFRFQVFLERVGPSYRSQPQETLRVAVSDALFVCGASREFIQEGAQKRL